MRVAIETHTRALGMRRLHILRCSPIPTARPKSATRSPQIEVRKSKCGHPIQKAPHGGGSAVVLGYKCPKGAAFIGGAAAASRCVPSDTGWLRTASIRSTAVAAAAATGPRVR